jgi:hypothetical protein
MANAARITTPAPRPRTGSFGRALETLAGSILSGQVRETTLASAALFMCKEASTDVLEAGLKGGLEAGLHWLQLFM